MAYRVLSHKLRHRLSHSIRPLNSSPPSLTAITAPELVVSDPITSYRSVLDLTDAEKLFAPVPTTKLLRSTVNLHLVAIDLLVDVGLRVLKSPLLKLAPLREAVQGTIRHTFFEQFCAGEDHEEMRRTVRRMAATTGLRGMLVYGVEDADENEACDRNLERFVETVESTKWLPPSSASFIIVKISAICPIGLLRRVSDLLRWEHKDPSFHLPWKHNTLPIFSDSTPLYHTSQKPDPLTPHEEEDLRLGHQRLIKICQQCLEANVPLSVDAEYTSVQPAIDYLTYSSAIMFNKEDNPIIFGTIQAYLKDAKERLLLATAAAEKMGVPMGFKLVRGAYMSSESKLASSLGYDSPIHRSIRDTHDCYNECASFMLEKIAGGYGAVVLATHNVESGKVAAMKARDLGIGKENQKLQFAQLYGMSEALSFSLRNAGFVVSKYMPFGPIDMVMPYLLRRAEENRGLLSTSTLDRDLMRCELKRRFKQFFVKANQGGFQAKVNHGRLQATHELESKSALY